MGISTSYEIARTGKLQQYYTLYKETSVSSESCNFSSYSYVKNLAINEKRAIESFDKDFNGNMRIVESPQREYANLEAFDLKWKRTEKGFVTDPNKDFWALWRAEKSILKEIGFRVFKSDSGFFILFFRFVDNDGLIKAFEKLENLRKTTEVTGEFFGEIGKRVVVENATIKKVRECSGFYGDYEVIEIEKDNCKFLCKYTGSKYRFKENEEVSFRATVKSHEIIDFSNTTRISRIFVI